MMINIWWQKYLKVFQVPVIGVLVLGVIHCMWGKLPARWRFLHFFELVLMARWSRIKMLVYLQVTEES